MPTVGRVGPYRFFFYAGDHDEPVHVHVERDDRVAEFWLDPVRLCKSGGFSPREISVIEGLLHTRGERFIEAWNDYFGN